MNSTDLLVGVYKAYNFVPKTRAELWEDWRSATGGWRLVMGGYVLGCYLTKIGTRDGGGDVGIDC